MTEGLQQKPNGMQTTKTKTKQWVRNSGEIWK